MNPKQLLKLWAGCFALCAVLGFLPQPAGVLKFLMVTAALGFFIPPALLIHRAVNRRTTDLNTLRLIRNLSLLSLSGTLVALILNFMSVLWPEAVGDALYGVLIIVSSPMICGQYWLVSLFLWACLLMVCLKYLRKQ